jgi:hypothetical protein
MAPSDEPDAADSSRVRGLCWAAGIAAALAAGALIALAATAGTGTASPVEPAAPADPLLPDLRTRPHAELDVHGDELRLANTIVNTGVGPLQVYPEPTAGGDCDGDGDNDNDRRAYQRVFEDSADPGSPGLISVSLVIGILVSLKIGSDKTTSLSKSMNMKKSTKSPNPEIKADKMQ